MEDTSIHVQERPPDMIPELIYTRHKPNLLKWYLYKYLKDKDGIYTHLSLQSFGVHNAYYIPLVTNIGKKEEKKTTFS